MDARAGKPLFKAARYRLPHAAVAHDGAFDASMFDGGGQTAAGGFNLR